MPRHPRRPGTAAARPQTHPLPRTLHPVGGGVTAKALQPGGRFAPLALLADGVGASVPENAPRSYAAVLRGAARAPGPSLACTTSASRPTLPPAACVARPSSSTMESRARPAVRGSPDPLADPQDAARAHARNGRPLCQVDHDAVVADLRMRQTALTPEAVASLSVAQVTNLFDGLLTSIAAVVDLKTGSHAQRTQGPLGPLLRAAAAVAEALLVRLGRPPAGKPITSRQCCRRPSRWRQWACLASAAEADAWATMASAEQETSWWSSGRVVSPAAFRACLTGGADACWPSYAGRTSRDLLVVIWADSLPGFLPRRPRGGRDLPHSRH
mmetsp:Transcript_4071/g.11802  ORF Transcript_4071/g.11802 Transcript_4071/m.11802 type:complete len:328 (-) Transcript_4071:444-1427(-)